MGCGSSTVVKGSKVNASCTSSGTPAEHVFAVDTSENSAQTNENALKVVPSPEGKEISLPGQTTSVKGHGIAFEIISDTATKPVPKRLSRLEPIDNAPKLSAEELAEKQRLAERKRNSELEQRAKTASESRRLSKRKRELMVARELERQQHQARELEQKLQSAEKQREYRQLRLQERQKLKDQRLQIARDRKERMLSGVDNFDMEVEQDEAFNNDDVDSWLEGSNNETNTADTGFSSATSERIYSGRQSPRKPFKMDSRVTFSNSASTVDSCDKHTYKQSDQTAQPTQDDFFD